MLLRLHQHLRHLLILFFSLSQPCKIFLCRILYPAEVVFLRDRRSIFKNITKTTYVLHITFVTPWGVKFNANSGISNSCVEILDLLAAKSLAITPKKIEL